MLVLAYDVLICDVVAIIFEKVVLVVLFRIVVNGTVKLMSLRDEMGNVDMVIAGIRFISSFVGDEGKCEVSSFSVEVL